MDYIVLDIMLVAISFIVIGVTILKVVFWLQERKQVRRFLRTRDFEDARHLPISSLTEDEQMLAVESLKRK